MKREIAEYVSKYCYTCQRVKFGHRKPPGLLHPLHIPLWKWKHISMDFVLGLSVTSKTNNTIWVIVHRLTKSAHFIQFKKGMKFNEIAKTFTKEVTRLHGTPVSIVSDRDSRYASSFWQVFQKSMGTQLSFNITYHHQTDGQSE